MGQNVAGKWRIEGDYDQVNWELYKGLRLKFTGGLHEWFIVPKEMYVGETVIGLYNL